MTTSENLIKPPITRADIGAQTGLNGKELTDKIKTLKAGGGAFQCLPTLIIQKALLVAVSMRSARFSSASISSKLKHKWRAA